MINQTLSNFPVATFRKGVRAVQAVGRASELMFLLPYSFVSTRPNHEHFYIIWTTELVYLPSFNEGYITNLPIILRVKNNSNAFQVQGRKTELVVCRVFGYYITYLSPSRSPINHRPSKNLIVRCCINVCLCIS